MDVTMWVAWSLRRPACIGLGDSWPRKKSSSLLLLAQIGLTSVPPDGIHVWAPCVMRGGSFVQRDVLWSLNRSVSPPSSLPGKEGDETFAFSRCTSNITIKVDWRRLLSRHRGVPWR
ncbi:hypothetical protein EJ04DRAFT_362169 [Polyplosphaeria fusca]|uniref:Uncharacterized protein n=1 Tax=Polyplosphaeria fusca TaxID=682080 RepID=A0A9P4QUD3_9PLEO|nr:hypothetical protein EJ04DRAFT_362169 [Polyplosphaeria fusca]